MTGNVHKKDQTVSEMRVFLVFYKTNNRISKI